MIKAIHPLIKLGFLTTFLLVVGAFTYQIAVPQTGSPRYFSETGHSVEDEFLEFYQRVPNPELLYGYPITDQMQSEDGLIVQYFQRARFELHPEAEEGQRIQLTPLGTRMYQTVPPALLAKNQAICRTFENGLDVCYSFLQFYEEHGGLAQFGPPISPVEERGSRYVQYFQYARLEWHPDGIGVDLSQEVQISQLGRQYFDQMGEDPVWLLPVKGIFNPEIITLQVHAFPAQAAVSDQQIQTLYVIVQDQNLTPIQGMNVTLTMTYPTGETNSLSLGTTNEFGYTSGDIPVGLDRDGVGLVDVEVVANGLGMEKSTRTSFRIAP